jgi:TRAP-type C4-dicarboxylate transport system substrate-binding protein
MRVNQCTSREIARRQAEIAERVNVTREAVIAGLYREATAAEANADGRDTQASARARSWELLGKHLGMFAERVEQDTRVRISVEFVNEYAAGGAIEQATRRAGGGAIIVEGEVAKALGAGDEQSSG